MATNSVLHVFLVSLTCIYQLSSQDACNSGPLELSGYNGSLSSPNYPGNYQDYAFCQWRIQSSLDYVYLGFRFFITEYYGSKTDVVRGYDGYNQSSRLLNTFYGSYSANLPGFTSSQPYLYITFQSDNDTSYQGFTADYTSKNVCQTTQHLRSFSGTLESPNYPNNYPNGRSLCYIIESLYDYVTFVFDDFNLEIDYDYLYLFDGDSRTQSPLIAKLTGSKVVNGPNNFTSTQKFMFVWFYSDEGANEKGYQAVFTSARDCQPKTNLEFNVLNGAISSPGFPSNYSSNLALCWLIQSIIDLVHIEFIQFNTEKDHDNVLIYDGSSANTSRLIARLSGEMNGFNVTSTQEFMFVQFLSDEATEATGFTAVFTSVPACVSNPVHLSSITGTISSAGYPNNYYNNECDYWLITSSYGEIGSVHITFTHMDTEDQKDFVHIFDGSTHESPLVARLTGNNPGSNDFTSSQQFLLVRFFSNDMVSGRGFEAVYLSLQGPGLPLKCWKGKVFKKNRRYCRRQLCWQTKTHRVQRRRFCKRTRASHFFRLMYSMA